MKKILVVEDDPAIRLALETGLAEDSYDVLIASDGIDGLRRLCRSNISMYSHLTKVMAKARFHERGGSQRRGVGRMRLTLVEDRRSCNLSHVHRLDTLGQQSRWPSNRLRLLIF